VELLLSPPNTGNVWSCYYPLLIQVMCGVVIGGDNNNSIHYLYWEGIITTPYITCIRRGY
jgi:hypothetical protein